jgi:hypothetical protein
LIENISQHPILSIAIDYGRIQTAGQWYRYDGTLDALIPLQEEPKSLFDDKDREADCELYGDDRDQGCPF